MRRLAAVLLLVATAGAQDADGYFEVGVDYLRKGFFGAARRAFSESLVRAPGQPVPLAFLGLACAAEGRGPAEAAALLRTAYARLPEGKTLRLDLNAILPSRRALSLLTAEYRRRLERAEGPARRDVLSVAAFLEVHDGRRNDAPSLERLRREFPEDPYADALAIPRPASARPDAAPTTPPSPSAPSGAVAGSSWDRSRSSSPSRSRPS